MITPICFANSRERRAEVHIIGKFRAYNVRAGIGCGFPGVTIIRDACDIGHCMFPNCLVNADAFPIAPNDADGVIFELCNNNITIPTESENGHSEMISSKPAN